MTKQHFIALADALRRWKPQDGNAIRLDQWTRDVVAVADACQDANPKFNRERWLNYIKGLCGPNGGAIT
jgi:hypothetical protein